MEVVEGAAILQTGKEEVKTVMALVQRIHHKVECVRLGLSRAEA